MNQEFATATPFVLPEEGSTEYLELLGRVKIAMETKTPISVDVSTIRPNPSQPRSEDNQGFSAESLAELANAIDSGAQTSRGLIRKKPEAFRYDISRDGTKLIKKLEPSEYEVIDGERRWRAICLIPEARRPQYQGELVEADDDVVNFIVAGMTNFNREGHNTYETIGVIQQYVSFGLPLKVVANLLGLNYNWVHALNALPSKLHPRVYGMLSPKYERKKGERPVTVSAAVTIARIGDQAKHFSLAHRLATGKITPTRLRTEVARIVRAEGSPIHALMLEPRKQMESFRSKMGAAARLIADAKDILNARRIDAHIRGLSEKDRAELMKEIRTSESGVNKIIALMGEIG